VREQDQLIWHASIPHRETIEPWGAPSRRSARRLLRARELAEPMLADRTLDSYIRAVRAVLESGAFGIPSAKGSTRQ
jgi:hypothetical protein